MDGDWALANSILRTGMKTMKLKEGEVLCMYCAIPDREENCYMKMWKKDTQLKKKELKVIRCPDFVRKK